MRTFLCLAAVVVVVVTSASRVSAGGEFWRGQPGEKLAVWLLAFSAAVVGVQALSLAGREIGNRERRRQIVIDDCASDIVAEQGGC